MTTTSYNHVYCAAMRLMHGHVVSIQNIHSAIRHLAMSGHVRMDEGEMRDMAQEISTHLKKSAIVAQFQIKEIV